MPAMPGSALVVIESKLILAVSNTILDRHTMAFDRHQGSMRFPLVHQVVKKARSLIGDATTDK